MYDAFPRIYKEEEMKRIEDQKEGSFKINPVGPTSNAQEKEKPRFHMIGG